MTVSKEPPFDWSRSGLDFNKAPYESCSPNLQQGLNHLTTVYGAKSLGCHLDRSVAGTSVISAHAYGAALDITSDGGYNELFQVIAPYLIANSLEFGIQAIHNYGTSQRWDPIKGWHAARIGPSATHMHMETSKTKFLDNSTWGSRIHINPPAPPPPTYNPPSNWGPYPKQANKPGLGPGAGWGTPDLQPYCRYANDVMILKAGQAYPAPAAEKIIWTLYSMANCMNVQNFFGIYPSGWVDPQTWAVLDFLANKK